MNISENKLISWKNLSFSLSFVTFLIFLISAVIYSDLLGKGFAKPEAVVLENIEILTIKSPKSIVRRLAIYKNRQKILTASCLHKLDICNEFKRKTFVSRIVGVKQTSSSIIIKEIAFADGYMHLDLNDYEIEKYINSDLGQAIKSIVIFFSASLFFLVLGFLINNQRKKLCQSKE